MKKNWLTPEIDELTITSTAKTDFNGNNNNMSPDEFHPERFNTPSGIAYTPVPTNFPGQKPGNLGGHGGHHGRY